MKPLGHVLGRGLRGGFEWAGAFALWTLWLGLVALLFVQVYIATAHELAVPEFALRRLEAKLAASGLRATFSRTSFDPTGRVLIENVRLSSPNFADPIVSARSVYLQLSPWPLVVGRVEPREVRVAGAVIAVPAAFSTTGQPDEIVRDLHATFQPSSKVLVLHQANARVAGVTVTARGSIPIARSREPSAPAAERISAFLHQQFPALCRQAIEWQERLRALEQPSLELTLSPSESGALVIDASAMAPALKFTEPTPIAAARVRASMRWLMLGETPASHLVIHAAEVRVTDAVVHHLEAQVYGRIRRGSTEFDVREVTAVAERVTVAGVRADAVSVRAYPRPWPQLHATVVANVLAAPLAVVGDTHVRDGIASLRFQGSISPRVLDLISRQVKVDVRRFYDFESLAVEQGEAHFGPKWQFGRLTARVQVPRMNSYGVTMEDGRAVIELTPGHFRAPEAYARVGENFARGSYEHDFRTHQYRFLLQGRLRPLAISPWFKEWWPNFFRQLEFPASPPNASVDVAGFWREGRKTTVFVFADAAQPLWRGAAFDRVRTRLFIRPAYFDGLEIAAQRATAGVHGRFTLVSDPATHGWRTLELGLDSTLELPFIGQLLGPAGEKALAPFHVPGAPSLKIRGSFGGPAGPKDTPDKLRIEARTSGEFRYHGFPLEDVSFIATVDGDEVVLDNVEALFAGGVTGGQARVWGQGDQRRLGFDYTLKDASLGQAVGALQQFFAAQKGQVAAPPGKFLQEKANVRVNFAASAEGRYNDPLSFRGDGSATLQGAEIGEVQLLGALSELLKFTALRFTDARANFKIEGPKVLFPQVELRGADAAVDAHGEYALDRRELNFSAKIFPFQESGNLLKSVVGAVLTPLSNALEVKLTGSVEKPQWAFLMGPTNFLRSLAPGGGSEKPVPLPSAAAPDVSMPAVDTALPAPATP